MAYEVSANTNTGAGAFMTQGDDAATWNMAKREFKYRYHYAGKNNAVTKDPENGNAEVLADGTYHKDLLELIKWTSDSDNSTFRGELAAHWSLNHLIDYFLFVYVVGLVDNFGKNFVIATWGRDADLNTVFYPMLYDADSCTGLTNEGQLTNGPQIDLEQGSFMTIESRLWSRLIDKQNGFWTEIIGRYGELRQTWFTVDKILEYYNDGFIDQIGQRFYNEDARLKYTAEKHQNYLYLVNGTRREYTKRWLRERLIYLDSVFEYATSFEKKGTIRTNVSDYLSLKIKMKSPRYIKIKWTDSLSYNKYYVGSDKLYEFRSPVPVTNTGNNLDMLGVDGIVEIESFTHLKPSYIQLDGMDNITKCIAQDSELLTEVSIGRNKMLQYIDFNGCTNLGKNELGESTGSLNVIHCENLKHLDISGTSFVAVSVVDINAETPDPSLAKGSGSIEYFNASNTAITDITIWNQTYLSEIQMSGCEHLATINVGNCERLHTMNLPDTNISTFTIVDCMALSYINISNTPKLVSLRLDGCPNLETLIMQRVNSQNLPELDLTTCPKLITLDVSHCSFLSKITFAAGYNLLENFYIENSVLTSVRFGKADTFPTYLNLAPFKLKSTGFLNCPSLVEIRGLNYEGTGWKLFYNCYNLETVQGSVKIKEGGFGISQMFYNCKKLVNLPTMDLTNAVDASETCFNCKKFTMDHAVTIMNALGSALTGSWRFFYGCSGIVGELPQTFFNKVPNLGSLSEFFQSCSGINGTIPPTLLAPLGGSLTSVERCFENCTGITGPLSDQLFAQNPNLRTTAYCFQGCRNITSTIPANLLSRNSNLTSTYWMFNNCTKLTGNVPNTFFRNNKNLNEVQGTVSNCSGLYGEIPMDFFQTSDGTNFNWLWKANNFFAGCTGLYGELRDTFFKFLPKLQEAAAFFASTKITGTIPENLLTAKTSLTTIESLFKDCTGLTGGIPKYFFNPPVSYGSSTRAPLTNLTNITTVFSGCTGLDGSIPTELLKGCTSINKVAGLFQNCRKLIGRIPEDILNYSDEILTISGMFDGCQTLSGSIPANIFKKCSKVTDMTAVFRYAYRLTGEIPEGLFSECFKVVTMEQMFRCCKGIGNPYVNDLNPYAMPTTLFESCYDLQNVNLMFYMYDALGGDDSLKGKIPPKLFEGKTKLLQAQEMFRSCDKLTGTLSRYFCAQSTSLQNISGMFWGCTSLQTIEANIFDYNLNITNVSNTFRDCSALTGPAYPFWEKHSKVTSYGSCYAGASKLTGTIPDNWK